MAQKAFKLQTIFSPKSIAIIGASKNKQSIGGKPLHNLLNHDYEGDIYLVNPRYGQIEGITCYKSVLEIPAAIDIALIATSHKIIKAVMEECGEKGIKQVILFGAGFAELGEEGERLQDEVLTIAQQYNMRIVGPNCVGCLNVIDQIPMGFATSFEADSFISGNVGLVSQSGAFGYSVFGIAQEEYLGFSYIANTGNQVDLTTLDFLEEMVEDEQTEVIATYLESIPDGRQFINVLKRAKELKKPVIVLKAGRSEVGKKAALSHTASVAGSAEVYDAVAKQYGSIDVRDINDMIDTLKVFVRGKVTEGDRLGIITTSGASGIMMADMAEEMDISLAELSAETKGKIEEIIPSFGSVLNPIDITLQALNEKHILSDSIEQLVNSEECDIIVISTTLGGDLGRRVCEDIIALDQQTDKPIIVNLTGREDIIGEGLTLLQQARVPVYQTPLQTIQSIKKLVEFSDSIDKSKEVMDAQKLIEINVDKRQRVLTEDKVKPILEHLSFKVPKGKLIKTKEALNDLDMTYPVVMKAISSELLHKSDYGAVKLGIENEIEAVESFEEIQHNIYEKLGPIDLDGMLVEEMIRENNTAEMFIGVKLDPVFGPIVACGFGGIFIEILRDVSLRRAPFSKETALEMISELKGYPILQGARGNNPLDIDAFAEALQNVSYFAAQHHDSLDELDINPAMLLEDGIVALDGLLIWKK